LGKPPFNNAIFEPSNRPLREYGIYGHRWRCALRERLAELGYDLRTIDLGDLRKAEKTIFVSMHRDPYFYQCLKHNIEMVLFEVEFPIGAKGEDGDYPDEWYRSQFDRVLTWNEELVDNKKIFKVNRPNNYYRGRIDRIPFEQRKLCVMMNSNKYSDFPLELYSERREAIKFFQEMCPEDFDLYGTHWDRSIVRYVTNRLPFATFNSGGLARKIEMWLKIDRVLGWLLHEEDLSRCYRGWTDNPFVTLSKYRFAIIYEIIGGMRGAVTNKIFDCLQSGCIPIYLGASDIEKYVWGDLFVDKRKFTYSELLQYMKGFKNPEFDAFLEKRNTFLSSHDGAVFFEKDWAKEFCEALLC